jgi:hypothetical protein
MLELPSLVDPGDEVAGSVQQVLRELQTVFDEEGAGARAAGR